MINTLLNTTYYKFNLPSDAPKLPLDIDLKKCDLSYVKDKVTLVYEDDTFIEIEANAIELAEAIQYETSKVECTNSVDDSGDIEYDTECYIEGIPSNEFEFTQEDLEEFLTVQNIIK